MVILLVGVALWTAVHLFPPVAPARRAALVEKVGKGPYSAGFSLALVLAIVLISTGWSSAAPIDLWFPPAGLRHVATLLVLIAFVVFFAGRTGANIARFIRHPQLTAVKIWALAHLLANGDLRSVILFGGMLAWAVMGVIFANRRDGPRVRPGKAPLWRDGVTVAIGVVAWGVVAGAHPWLFGVNPFG